MKRTPTLGPLEKKVMEIVWRSSGDITVRAVVDEMQTYQEIAYTTVMTLMNRLVKKKFLERQKRGRSYVYVPYQSKQQAISTMIRQTILTYIDRFGEDAAIAFIEETDKLRNP